MLGGVQGLEIHTSTEVATRAPRWLGILALVFALFALSCVPLIPFAWYLTDTSWYALFVVCAVLVWVVAAVACWIARARTQRAPKRPQRLLSVPCTV